MTHEFAIRIKRLRPTALLPKYQTDGAAGMDLCAAEEAVIPPHGIAAVPTGWAVEVPHGYELQVRPRSGLTLKQGIMVANSPGTVDSDYRGEVCIILYNTRAEPFQVKRGDRIAQAIVGPVCRITWEETDDLSGTTRGANGFGSTGV